MKKLFLTLALVFTLCIACSGTAPAPPTPTPVEPTPDCWNFAFKPFLWVCEATPEPTATPTPEPTATATPIPPTPTPVPEIFVATRYGESYNGQNMGCIGAGAYSSTNRNILAAPPARYVEWPCGTQLRVCSATACIDVTRLDSCPGCGALHIDLSEQAIGLLCGLDYAATGQTCDFVRNLTVTLLSRPAGVIGVPVPEEEYVAERCADLIAPRYLRVACVTQVLNNLLPR